MYLLALLLLKSFSAFHDIFILISFECALRRETTLVIGLFSLMYKLFDICWKILYKEKRPFNSISNPLIALHVPLRSSLRKYVCYISLSSSYCLRFHPFWGYSSASIHFFSMHHNLILCWGRLTFVNRGKNQVYRLGDIKLASFVRVIYVSVY